jgi:periplasmic mercuric ion binding protein
MKNIEINLLAIILAVFLSFSSCGIFLSKDKKTNTSFTVSGNCDMCKERIESALDRPGILTAFWSKEDQQVFITYRNDKLEEIQLHNIIAMVGHDTEKVKSDKVVYNNLPPCCHYRKEADEW